MAVGGVLEQKRQLVSLNCMPTSKVWFKLQLHVCDGKAGGLLTYLEQEMQDLANIHGPATKWCPHCHNKGLVNHLSENHVFVSCQAMAYERSASGLKPLMTGKA